MKKFNTLAVHGRFQPPLHINHWNYIKYAFDNAESVEVYITNPNSDESFEPTASWRNNPVNNPFNFKQRKQMFEEFFRQKKISSDRFAILPFNITNDESFSRLKPEVPMVVNVYSAWSAKKLDNFRSHGIQVVELTQPKQQGSSGTKIREIIKEYAGDTRLDQKLVDAGFMPDALPGLKQVLGQI